MLGYCSLAALQLASDETNFLHNVMLPVSINEMGKLKYLRLCLVLGILDAGMSVA